MTQITIPKLEFSETKSGQGASLDDCEATIVTSPQSLLTSTAQTQARTFASTHTCPGCVHNFNITAILTIHAPNAEAQPRILKGLEVDQNNGNVKISLEIGEQKPVVVVQGDSVGEYLALYDFKGQKEDELSLVEGEGVVVIHRDESGWTLVKNMQRSYGWVPTTYLEKKKDWRGGELERKLSALPPYSTNGKSVGEDDDDEW